MVQWWVTLGGRGGESVEHCRPWWWRQWFSEARAGEAHRRLVDRANGLVKGGGGRWAVRQGDTSPAALGGGAKRRWEGSHILRSHNPSRVNYVPALDWSHMLGSSAGKGACRGGPMLMGTRWYTWFENKIRWARILEWIVLSIMSFWFQGWDRVVFLFAWMDKSGWRLDG